MPENPSIKERRERLRKQRVRVRARRGGGEKRSSVTGAKSAATSSGNYVNVYDWTAYFFPYTYTLEVSALVTGVGSNSIANVAINMQPSGGGGIYASAEASLNEPAGSVDIIGTTGLVDTMPATVLSYVTGTVSTGSGSQYFQYSQTLNVYNADDDVKAP